MTADLFYIVLTSFCCYIFKYTSEIRPIILAAVSSVKLYWHFEKVNFILRLSLQIESVVIEASGNYKFENG